MMTHLKQLQTLLKIDLRQMIDHALQIQSLKVMVAYQRKVEEELTDVKRRLKWLKISTDDMKANYERYAKMAQDQKAREQEPDTQPPKPEASETPVIWVPIFDTPIRTAQEIADEMKDLWQSELGYMNALSTMRDNLQRRLQVTQAIYDTLKSNDFPTIENDRLQPVYGYADIEAERTSQVLDEMAQNQHEDTAYHIRHLMRSQLPYGDGLRFRYRIV